MGKAALWEKLVPHMDNKEAAHIKEIIDRLVETGESFAIWGAGNTGQGCIKYLLEHSHGKLKPQCIIDNNPSLWGRGDIVSPEIFFNTKTTNILFICSYVADQIIEQVKENGYTGEIIVFSQLVLIDNSKAWDLYEKNKPVLEQLYSMLEDNKSRESLEGFLNSIRSGDMSYLERINGNSDEKLLDPLIMKYNSEEVFVDVGAFTGDTISKFLELTEGRYKRIIGFEMDRQNYIVLEQNTFNDERIIVYHAAAGASNGKMRFWAGRSESSVISEQGDGEIEVVALDDVPEIQDASFIKVSANGVELPVLQGGEQLIIRNRPRLAVYASGDLLWKIPQYLKRIVPEYKLYYRHYGYGQQAMICYARCE